MTIFSCNSLSKAYDRGMLFEGVSFGMEEGERLGLIGRNGIGKTTLLRIVAGKEDPDSGNVVFNKNVNVEYLEQVPSFDSYEPILDAVMNAKPELYALLEEYKKLCVTVDKDHTGKAADRLQVVSQLIDRSNAWSLENEAKTFLSRLGVTELEKSIHELSGGMKKRVALARALLSGPELIIMDEPTNHLDADSVQWLQDRLMNSGNSLLFVTHDRYFLDAVATRIVELDRQRIFVHPGSYEKYLERKEAYESIHSATSEHTRSRLRTELAWLQKGAKARRTKQKSRIDWIERIKADSKQEEEKKIKIELGKTFLHSRVIDAVNISKSIGGKLLFKDFTYIAKPGDRIGIIGPNGTGKSTLFNVLSGRLPSDTGTVKIGPSVKIGYFTQENIELSPIQTVIGSLREIAEYIDTGVGRDRYLTARDLLNRFMFPHQQHGSFISTLSGGEKRRLALLRMLMNNPNVILLDEPTNDLDINTLGMLEEYLDDFYGVLLIVSHDRAFLDRTVNFIWAFEENGKIKEYPGNYSDYLEKKESSRGNKTQDSIKEDKPKREKSQGTKKKLSYMEQREFEELEQSIPQMEAKLVELQANMNSGEITDYKEYELLSRETAELEEKIEEATIRWLELSEKAQ